MPTFIMKPNEEWLLVHDFSRSLYSGEIVKRYEITTPSGITLVSHEQESKDVVLTNITTSDGTLSGVYNLTVTASTNRNRNPERTTSITIDENDGGSQYEDFYYRIQTYEEDNFMFILPYHENFPDLEYFWYNQQYDVSFLPGLSGSHNTEMQSTSSFWFTTQYCPLFTTVERVELVGGTYIADFAPDTVYRMIMKNSRGAIDIYNLSHPNVPYNYWGCTPDNVPSDLRVYVECKTAYDLLNIADRASAIGLSQTKTLGDMTIKYGGSSSLGAGSTPDLKRSLYDCFMSAMNAIANIRTAVRGIYNDSKGYSHPVRDIANHRTNKGVDFTWARPNGPWVNGPNWRGYYRTPGPYRRGL